MKKFTSKQFVVVDFADCKRAICRVCYDKLRFKRFSGSAEDVRAAIRAVDYKWVKELFCDV